MVKIVNRTSFKESLDFAKLCTNSKGFIPILSHICFTPNTVSSFNGTEGIVVNFETGLNCAVPAEVLTKLINSLPTEEVQLTESEGKVSVKAGHSSTKISTLPSSDFIIKIPPGENVPIIEITDDFILGINRCLITVNTDPGKQNQYGITLSDNILYSSDTIRISRYILNKETGYKGKLLLPKVFCELLTGIASKFSEVKGKLEIGNSYLRATLGNIQLFTEMINDVEFLDFERVISGTQATTQSQMQQIPITAINILDRCLLIFASSEEKILSLDVGNKFIEFIAQGSFGNHIEEITTNVDLNIGKFRVSILFLKELILNVREIGFAPGVSNVIIRGEDVNYLQLLSSLPLQ